MSNSTFSRGRQPCIDLTSSSSADDLMMVMEADAMECPVCFVADDRSTHWTKLDASAVAALMKAFPKSSEIMRGYWPLRMFTVSGDRLIRFIGTVPLSFGCAVPESVSIPYSERHRYEDAWQPERYQAMTDMGPHVVSQFVKLRAECVLNDMSWFADLDSKARNRLLEQQVTPVWHSAILMEYVRLSTVSSDAMAQEDLDEAKLDKARINVWSRHKYHKMKLPALPEFHIERYEGNYRLTDKSPATPDGLFRRAPSSSLPYPRSPRQPQTSPPRQPHQPQSSRKRTLPVEDDAAKRAKQKSIASYFGGGAKGPTAAASVSTVAQIKAGNINQSVEAAIAAFEPWLENTVSAINHVNECCYLHTEAQILFTVPSNHEMEKIPKQPFKTGIEMLESYVSDTQMSMVYACGVPRNRKRLAVIVNENLKDSHRRYVLMTPEILDSLVRKSEERGTVVSFHEVFFMNRIFTRLNFDIDAPWPGDFDCDAALYKKLAATMQALCYVVWSNTIGAKIQLRPLQMAVFRRPAKNKWSLRVLLKLPFNCAMRGIDVVASLVESMVREAVAKRLPYLTLTQHEKNKDLFAHHENDEGHSLLMHKPTRSPRWFSKSTGQYVEDSTPWTGGKVVSSIDVAVYGSHKSVRLPYCGKADGSRFLPVWTSPGTRAEVHWKPSRCLMSAPYTHNELTLLPELDHTLPFAVSESTMLQHSSKMKWTWGVPGAAALTKDRVASCLAAAEQHYKQKFTEKPRENFSMLISNKAVFHCELCGREHKNKQKICFLVFSHAWFLKCFHTTEVLYAALEPQTGALRWKERTAVCLYGE
ncbi:helicase-primase primase subunit [Cyprinid herpesvirus 3]|uniref:Helicase-primase primase subunit n=1 Tax=Cyprinid herpesvirus 3 TaxID=180230 RepID=A3QML4_CYHV3|nr:unnamed protein product [Cyprinid herpesvirus 3]ABC55199.1 hypothetical protein [Cyprinid herpesvirus 3]ABG42873.1 helicase-primase primase subunit [Cyprinid herpesvirus 3]AIC32401.1 ORF46R [Cyprinid herpesvirus 3]AJP55535.1 helicase-primase primase subunit [Cyprinid herpesvirus 3]AJP55692.1 helicase-primase primase subunit [Cyprinid herpesvirus 3]